MTRNAAPRGPSTTSERALALDLARGSMLLFISLANTVLYLWALPMDGFGAHPVVGGTADRVTQFLVITMVDLRSYPMFAFLFGYGIVQLARRQAAAGADPRDVRGLLRRRHLWLIVFGFAHAALLWMGDILGAYGLAGLVLVALFFRRRDTTLLVWSAAMAGILLLLSLYSVATVLFTDPDSLQAFDMAGSAAPFTDSSYLSTVVARLSFWPVVTGLQGLGLAVPTAILLGMWAARRRVLEEPGRHLRLLTVAAVGGLAVGWLGGLPAALGQIGVLELVHAQLVLLMPVHMLTGVAGGVGYVSLIGLAAHALAARGRTGGPVVTALSATGKRSLSAYLAQSVLCAPVLAAWGLGLGAHLAPATMALFAIGVWLVTLMAAYALERAGHRGPAEVALRRLAYRRAAESRAADGPDALAKELP